MNKESLDILEDYILELKSKGRAEKTIEQYRWDILHFLEYVKLNYNNKSILELKKRDFRNFFLNMREDGKSSARINRVMSSVRNMLEFVVDDEDDYDDYNKNPMKKIKSLEKNPVKEIVFLTDEQVTFLIDYLLEHGMTQKALYVSLSYDSAGRRGEIAQVEKHSFLQEGVYKTQILVGKRGKKFALMYTKRTKTIAKKWLEERGEDSEDSLWVTKEGENVRKLGSNALYGWAVSFRAILENKYQEDIPLGSHSFRHSALENYENATHHSLKHLGKERLDINTLRILANHNDVGTTQSYLKNKDEEILNDLFSN